MQGLPWLTLSEYRSSGSPNHRKRTHGRLITSQRPEQTFECPIQPGKSGLETYSIFCVLCDLDLLIDSVLIKGRLIRCAVKQSTCVTVTG